MHIEPGLFATLGQKLKVVTMVTLLKLDSAYYAGFVAMIGFWLLQADAATPLAGWAVFAASYLPLVLVETLAVLWLIGHAGQSRLGALCFAQHPALSAGSAA